MKLDRKEEPLGGGSLSDNPKTNLTMKKTSMTNSSNIVPNLLQR